MLKCLHVYLVLKGNKNGINSRNIDFRMFVAWRERRGAMRIYVGHTKSYVDVLAHSN